MVVDVVVVDVVVVVVVVGGSVDKAGVLVASGGRTGGLEG